jgi:hypothetical protein
MNKTLAIQKTYSEVDVSGLHDAKSILGHVYYYRPADSIEHIMVCHPNDYAAASTWLEINGWHCLPHVLDTSTVLSTVHVPLLQKHDPSIVATDNTVQVMKKLTSCTKMRCWSPF